VGVTEGLAADDIWMKLHLIEGGNHIIIEQIYFFLGVAGSKVIDTAEIIYPSPTKDDVRLIFVCHTVVIHLAVCMEEEG
jgi:hypothetical protein